MEEKFFTYDIIEIGGSFILAGSYVVIEHVNEFETVTTEDVGILKTDEDGDIIWIKSYINNQLSDKAEFVIQTSDGGFFTAGIYYLGIR